MMQCPSCGAYASAEDAFCGECGRPLADLDLAPETPLPAPEAKPVSAEAEEPSSPSSRPGGGLLLAPPARPAAAPPPARKGTSPLVPILILVSLGLLVCFLGGGLFLWRTLSQSEGPASTAVTGLVIYHDDFSDANSGWDVYDEDDTQASYEAGEYRLAVYQANYMTWANPDDQDLLFDYQVEVDARQVAGPLDNNYGLLVRYQPDDEDDDYYWFQISGDGYYSVDARLAGEWVTLVGWEASDAINQGLEAVNHLMVVCDGDLFDFYVNGTHLTSMVDDTLVSGGIGLAVGAYDESGVVVHFDNLSVVDLWE